MRDRAASYAADLESHLGERVEMIPGRRGQFEVRVHGKLITSRKGGLIAMLIKRPWPDMEGVRNQVREALARDVEP